MSPGNTTQTNEDPERGLQPASADTDTAEKAASVLDHGDKCTKDVKFLARFEDGDAQNPLNFSTWRKALITFMSSMLALAASMGSSIVTPAEDIIADYLDISVETAVLILSLFILGCAFGPILWGPVSEVYGRRWSMLPPMFALVLFSIGTALSTNAPAIFLTRFFAGVFGSSPISNVSALLGDIYSPRDRGVAMAFAAMCVVGGPTIAPLIGAAITVNPHLGWRWTEWCHAILTGCIVVLAVFLVPETYAPVLLKRKAAQMRKDTGDVRYWHPQEEEKVELSSVVHKYLSRPLRMLFTEPTVLCISLYASFSYGLLFLTLEVFPIVFRQERGFGPVVSTLPFLGLYVGVLCALGINIANQPQYAKAVERNNGKASPEARLPPMAIGGVFFTTGIFWFGWTAGPQYHWAIPVVATGFIGAGFNIVYQQCLNFLVDTYGPYAASAGSANTILRSFMASGLPLAARPMFLNMGVGPAASVLGAISCLALPLPFVFMKYGKRLRANSKFAPTQ